MAQGKNGLLSKLILAGVASAVTIAHVPAAFSAVTPDTPAITAAEQDTMSSIMDLVAFLRAYPNSPMARQVAAQIPGLMSRLSPAAKAAVAANITASGGLPAKVAALVGLPASPVAALPVPATINGYQ